MRNLILASGSPRRKALLEQINADFEIIVGDVDEDISNLKGESHEKAEFLALKKARHVANKLNEGLVLGADTIVVLDDEIFTKPKDEEDSHRMLELLSNREHFVITGIAIVDALSGEFKVAHEQTKVTFCDLTPSMIKSYIDTKEPFGKAGAYAIQGVGTLLVEKIEGCFFNVVGLPINRLNRLLHEFGANIL